MKSLLKSIEKYPSSIKEDIKRSFGKSDPVSLEIMAACYGYSFSTPAYRELSAECYKKKHLGTEEYLELFDDYIEVDTEYLIKHYPYLTLLTETPDLDFICDTLSNNGEFCVPTYEDHYLIYNN